MKMLLVKTVIKKSSIHGLGLFANQKIKSGQIVWKYNPILDKKISRENKKTALFHAEVC